MPTFPPIRPVLLRFAAACLLACSPALAAPTVDERFADGAVAYTRADPARAMQLWQPLAEAGNVDAQFGLGMLCAGAPEPPVCGTTEAFEWYARAATAGHRLAQFNLGMAYRQGIGTASDEAQARHWLLRAAEQGLPAAREALAAVPVPAPAPAPDPSPAPNPAPTPEHVEPATLTNADPAPHGDAIDWLLAQDPQHFTVQLAAGPVVEDMRRLRRRHRVEDDTHVLCAPATCYLVLGSFATNDEAQAAIEALAPALRERKPWARAFGFYRSRIAAAGATPAPEPPN